MISIKVDMEGQRLKSSTLRAVPRAFQRNATQWASQTLLYIKKELGSYFSRPPKELDQRLGMKVVKTSPDSAQILLGTGVHIGRPEVIYARIQEEGGWTNPRVTPAMRRWAWAMYYKGFKSEIRGAGLRGAARKGAFATYGGMDNVFKSIALTKQDRLHVKLPARHWFTRPIAERMPDLQRTMSPEGVWATAQQLAYKRTAAQGGEA
jgi:hypothetical protein